MYMFDLKIALSINQTLGNDFNAFNVITIEMRGK